MILFKWGGQWLFKFKDHFCPRLLPLMSPFPKKGAMNAEFIILFFLPFILLVFITIPGTTIEYDPLVTKYICTRPRFQILHNKWQKDIAVKRCNTGMWKGAKKGTWLANATVVVFSFFLFFGNFPFTSSPFYSEANSPLILSCPVKNYIMSHWQRNRWRFVTNSNICHINAVSFHPCVDFDLHTSGLECEVFAGVHLSDKIFAKEKEVLSWLQVQS